MSEKTFTVVGTAINANGEMKMRWANDLANRIKILIKADCEDIDLIELPQGMTKLAAAEYLKQHRTLSPEQEAVVDLKIGEKRRMQAKAEVKATLTANVNATVASGKTDPKVAAFIEKELA